MLKRNGVSSQYEGRIRYEHTNPNYFPQAGLNPQEPCCDSENALGEFRRWPGIFVLGKENSKITSDSKIKQKQLPASFAQLAISACGIKDE